MDFITFDRAALRLWTQIPEGFRQGVSALCVEQQAKFDVEFPDVCLMGECVSDPITDFPGAPIRSLIYIYYGSFNHIAGAGADFDWEAELWETLTHELLHHLEWAAGYDALGKQDDLQRENMARQRGEAFNPTFYRHGLALDKRVYQADGCLFIEIPLGQRAWAQLPDSAVQAQWRGLHLRATEISNDMPRETTLFVKADVEVQDGGRLPWYDVILVLRSVRGPLRWLKR